MRLSNIVFNFIILVLYFLHIYVSLTYALIISNKMLFGSDRYLLRYDSCVHSYY